MTPESALYCSAEMAVCLGVIWDLRLDKNDTAVHCLVESQAHACAAKHSYRCSLCKVSLPQVNGPHQNLCFRFPEKAYFCS